MEKNSSLDTEEKDLVISNEKKSTSSTGDSHDSTSEQISSDNPAKKQRTDHRDPRRVANIEAAIEYLLQMEQTRERMGLRRTTNLKEVSRQFNIPYNTLRDNFLR